MPRLTLIGYRGCGKSSVAALVADRLGCGWQDADHLLEERVGTTVAEFIRSHGEERFRDEEAAILEDLLVGPAGQPYAGVLATGGGVVLREANRALLRSHGRPVVWLTAPAEVVRGRLAADPTTRDRRPALSGGDPLAEVAAALARRESLYRACADRIIDTSGVAPAVVATEIVAWLDGGCRP